MEFSISTKQQELKAAFTAFAQEALNSSVLEKDKNSIFSKAEWLKCAAFGVQGLTIPKAYGGSSESIDLLTAVMAMESLGYGCRDNGLLLALGVQMWTVHIPIVTFGTVAQKEKFLPKMASGALIACHALSEPEAGSDVFSMKTTARKVEGGYLLNGSKCFITLGPIADVALVFASTNPKVKKWGISAFLVALDSPGVSRSTNKEKMGLRSVPIGDLHFKDCFVPEAQLLGKEGAGWSITNHSLEHDRCSILATQLGAMARQLDSSIAYVKTRKQYGKPIGEFQSVSNRIADMKLRIETSRLLLYQTAWLKGQDKPAMLEAALLKLQLTESYISSSLDHVRNHGGMGYLVENEVERDLRDAVGSAIYAGTSDIQRNIISKLLGL